HEAIDETVGEAKREVVRRRGVGDRRTQDRRANLRWVQRRGNRRRIRRRGKRDDVRIDVEGNALRVLWNGGVNGIDRHVEGGADRTGDIDAGEGLVQAGRQLLFDLIPERIL